MLTELLSIVSGVGQRIGGSAVSTRQQIIDETKLYSDEALDTAPVIRVLS